MVCNPRRNALLNALLKEGSKSDKVDARKLAELLRTGMLRPVYHWEHGLRTLRELARSYQTISKDLTRVMNRLKALYRGFSTATPDYNNNQVRVNHLKAVPADPESPDLAMCAPQEQRTYN